MSFLLFLRGFVGVLIVFAVASYLITHSLWTAFAQTVICAVLIQAGYFAAVLFLVWREKPKRAPDKAAGAESASVSVPPPEPERKAPSLRGARR
jgi:exopolysaccharide production repressor protein